jgi:hypothetical protein
LGGFGVGSLCVSSGRERYLMLKRIQSGAYCQMRRDGRIMVNNHVCFYHFILDDDHVAYVSRSRWPSIRHILASPVVLERGYLHTYLFCHCFRSGK